MSADDRVYAKRCMAEAALREALRLCEETKHTGGFSSYGTTNWDRAGTLASQAAEQLRQAKKAR